MLCDFPREVLAEITEWLSGKSVSKLWCCGDKTLNVKFSLGGVKVLTYQLGDEDAVPVVFPPLVLKLRSLECFSLIVPIHGAFSRHIDLPVATLPMTLRKLELVIGINNESFQMGSVPSSLSHDIGTMFPTMQKLTLSCGLGNLPLGITSMNHLESLFVPFCSFSFIPHSV
jgi:hypothetical protein